MKILGIETSCDETAAAVVADGRHLLSNAVHSQIDLHAHFGGVVPEVAARSHIETIIPVIDQAVSGGGGWDEIDGIAVTHGPGLGGSLLIGTLSARTLAVIKQKPLYGVHHALGHIYANFIDWTKQSAVPLTGASSKWQEPQFPLLALIVSGGHSHLVLMNSHENYRLLGQTQDDAVGEAFDKVAKVLGLSYPGGPSVQAAAEQGDPKSVKLPKAQMRGYDFSFSGLKTAVLRAVQAMVGVDYNFPSYELKHKLSAAQVNDVAASFQATAARTLVDTVLRAYRDHQPKSVVIAGGVAANTELRRQLQAALPLELLYAPVGLCTDNGAMIASLGYYAAQHHRPVNPFKLDINTSLSL